MIAPSSSRAGITPRAFQLLCRRGIAGLPERKPFSRKPVARKQNKPSPSEILNYPPRPSRSTPRKKNARPNGPILQQYKDDSTEGINWYEQDPRTGERVKVEEDPEEDERKRVLQEIRQLDAELSAYESPDTDTFLNEGLLKALSASDRAKINRLRNEQQKREDKALEGLKLEVSDLRREELPIVNVFNRSVRSVALEPQKLTNRSVLWKAYDRCKATLGAQRLFAGLSDRAWNVLSNCLPTLPKYRAARVVSFTDDKKAAERSLTIEEQSLRVLALWEVGERAQAFAELSTIEKLPKKSLDVWQDLVRMYAELGDIAKSSECLSALTTHYAEQYDPRIVIPVISAALRDGKDRMAFGLYIFMRDQLGNAMRMEEYDDVTLIFLGGGKKDLALAVFRDMMLQGSPKDRNISVSKSVAQFKAEYEAIAHRVGTLINIGQNAEEVNRLSLTTISVLPRAWQNKFFYSSWLKKLLGMGRLGESAQVLELMCERGVKPDAIHINGFIGASFRDGSPEHVGKAEDIAWAMIQKRMTSAWNRRELQRKERNAKRESLGSIVVPNEGQSGPPELVGEELPKSGLPSFWRTRELPQATLETFSVLILHYLLQGQYALMRKVHRSLSLAELEPNIYFINQSLQGRFYENGAASVWTNFNKWTQGEGKPRPDKDTYSFLWETQVRHLRHIRFRQTMSDPEKFPEPRILFKSMAEWLRVGVMRQDQVPDGATNTATDEVAIPKHTPDFLDDKICSYILQSFGLTKDLPGTLVALHALFQLGNRWPSKLIEETLFLSIAALPVAQRETARGRQRGSRTFIKAEDRNLEGVKKTFNKLVERRIKQSLRQDGLPVSDQNARAQYFEGAQGGVRRLQALCELLRLVIDRVHGNSAVVEPDALDGDITADLIAEAASEMGVSDLDFDPIDEQAEVSASSTGDTG